VTTYSPEQLGAIEIRPVSTKTKPSSVALIVIHEDGDQTAIAQPLAAGADPGRQRVLELVANGVDPADIRICIIPDGAVGGDEATDGQPLQPVSAALWWTRDDDRRRGARTRAAYATALLERFYAPPPRTNEWRES